MPRTRRGSANNSLQAQVNRLTQAVAQMSTTSRRGRSRSRRRVTTPGVVLTSVPAGMSNQVTRSRSRARTPGPFRQGNNLSLTGSGSIRFQNREIFRTLKISANKSTLTDYAIIDATSFGFLSKLGKLFGRMRWHRVTFFYESSTSSNTGGTVAYGLDWGLGITAPSDIIAVTTLNPSISHPLWAIGARLNVNPSAALNSRVWYDVDADEKYDSALASMLIFAQTPTVTSEFTFGYIWIEYDVEFQGPKA